MKPDKRYKNQRQFWEEAGQIGYHKAVFASEKIGRYIFEKHWQAAVNTARSLGMDDKASILELGCGDGQFAQETLSAHFKTVDAFDISEAAIRRAQSLSKTSNVNYFAQDITNYEYAANAHWDGAFMLWILHHVKDYTPKIVSRLSRVCPHVVVIEPNGNNIIRKALEMLPSYKRAGERSFRVKELINIFDAAGYEMKTFQRTQFIPNFLPETLFNPFKKLEPFIEANIVLNRLCASYILGFTLRSEIRRTHDLQ